MPIPSLQKSSHDDEITVQAPIRLPMSVLVNTHEIMLLDIEDALLTLTPKSKTGWDLTLLLGSRGETNVHNHIIKSQGVEHAD